MAKGLQLTGRRVHIAIGIACGCAFSLFGYDQALFGGVASGPAFQNHFHSPSASLTGQIAALYDIGNLVGAVGATMIAARLGHRRSILLGSAIVVVGAIIQTAAVDVGMLIAGRIIGGVGNGINTSIVPVYHSETSKAHSRGRAVIAELFILDVGWLIAQFLTLGFSFVHGGLQWRFPTAAQVFYLVPVFAMMPFLPDSPRWLVSKGRIDEASSVIAQINGEADPLSSVVQTQLGEIREVVELEHAGQNVSLRELWKGPGRNVYRLALACGIQVMAQIGGINILAYYVVIIFQQQLGLGDTLSRVLAACAGIGWLVSNLLSMTVIESWGRKRLLFIGSIGQGLCFLVSGIVLAVGGTKHWAGIVVVIMVYIYFIVFAFAWQAIPFLYPAEILSLKYRNRFYGLSNGSNWLVNYAVVLATPPGIRNLGWKFYIIFAAFNFANFIVVYVFYIETARKSLEDIDLMFFGRASGTEKEEKIPPALRLLNKGALTKGNPSEIDASRQKTPPVSREESEYVEAMGKE